MVSRSLAITKTFFRHCGWPLKCFVTSISITKISVSITPAQPCMAQVLSPWKYNYIYVVDDDKKHIRYICRLACVTKMKNPPVPWDGPVSRSYLVFNSMVMEVSKNLHNLLEMMILALICGKDVKREGRDYMYWYDLGNRYFP